MSEGARAADPRRALPSVDRLLGREAAVRWAERWGREPVKEALRDALEEARRQPAAPTEEEALLRAARERLERRFRPSLRPVLNGTGVVLHTNLGRAPLAPEAISALEVAAGYANLEFDLERGERGSRHEHCAALLCELTGAEGALVVNNNAAAVSLAVNEFALGREVLVSRGELVEIGGSFRMPDVVARSGATLVEVGTTNRTRPEDYRKAIGPATGVILKVHPSNYRVEGFVGDVPLEDLVRLGREAGVPVVYDLGSGLLRPELLEGFPPEPGVRESVAAGADLVTWSGDKLLGGPQAGILVGRSAAVDRLRRNPLLRAFRVDKLTLAALEATLLLYRDPARAAVRVPALRALREPVESVERRAREALTGWSPPPPARVEVRRLAALPGGGSYPGHRVASAGWAVTGLGAEAVDAACRQAEPPLVGRIEEGAFLVDVRTLLPGQERSALRSLAGALERVGG